MSKPSSASRLVGPALVVLVCLAALYLIGLVYAVGQTLLAATLLVIVALALWTYTSRHTLALRYLFPGVAAAVIFVVFPMIYTVATGFTNYSSRNLLDLERSRQYLLDETIRDEGPAYGFTLHRDLHQYRLRLEDLDDDKRAFVSSPLALARRAAITVELLPEADAKTVLGDALTLKDVIAQQADLKSLALRLPDGKLLRMTSLREFAQVRPAYKVNPDGTLVSQADGGVLKPNPTTGFFETAAGEAKGPGFKVNIGFAHYARIFTDPKFSEPFIRIFIWTVLFSGLTIVFAASIGVFLAVLLNWEGLRFKGVYRLMLFLPYAVPGVISILIFKGLFNQNLGEVNQILGALFGIKPAWFADPLLAKTMLLIVNTWLGFPYMMVVCMGLIKSIPSDLYEASAVAGAGPLTNFFVITAPLILKPLTPLLIASFAFNFNNYVLIALLTGGRPDFLDISVPGGTTDILVSYTLRMAFGDSGQQFGLASAISTVIFLIVAAITLLQMRFTRLAQDDKR
ncbi:maltose ABC transporter permease MalF [Rubrivivax sp. A210]|uniref:maltose ABC transporter permease MalF n=1 Tax=Rubrivivax sp. A210 TaxID=2772301 RepID=UPI001F34DFDC|nr:maltose ABC transporter permease MalF [Rubrivivax sp. A210]